jgi:hypothetical protein
MVNKKSEDLLMDINPNLDEVIAEENAVNDEEEEHIENIRLEKSEHNEVFTEDKAPKPKTKIVRKTPVGLSREEKKAIREEEARKKFEEKQRKREETAQRNRERARLRYYEQKEKKEKEEKEKEKAKKEIPKKIIQETEKKMNNFQKAEVKQKASNDMDFHTFASYMMKYETMKEQYNKQKEAEKPAPVEKKKSYHPDNYPVSAMYRNRKKLPNNFM